MDFYKKLKKYEGDENNISFNQLFRRSNFEHIFIGRDIKNKGILDVNYSLERFFGESIKKMIKSENNVAKDELRRDLFFPRFYYYLKIAEKASLNWLKAKK